MANTKKKSHMSQEDIKAWEETYELVRHDILGYDENQALSKSMVLRLKGLLNNKYMANKNIVDTANYSYEVVLLTFKYSLPEIKRGLSRGNFSDEQHRFNYCLKIVESNLNTVYMKLKNAKKVEEKVEQINTSISTYNGAEYKPKKKDNNKFKDLW